MSEIIKMARGYSKPMTQHAMLEHMAGQLAQPIRTVHVGAIAFQGTEAEIAAMIRRTFGIDANPGL